MYSYGLLETGCYYLIQEKEGSPISLIKPTVETDHCLFISRYDDPLVTEWKRKNDPILDIIECLTDEGVRAWEKYYNSEDAYYGDEDED
ncbi:MAG TPA: hypothetical protein VG870_14385 [Chitinophagaceae bacterium]|nr:hypothetical protein [Chitinophagaceae bacterium]